MFFLNMFLSATRAPSPGCAAQALRGLPLCSSPLSPGQASGVTSRDRSHQLHARSPHRPSLCLSSWFLHVPKAENFYYFFFLFSVPALEAQGHPGSGSRGAVGGLRALNPPLSRTSRREFDAGQLSCWEAMSGLRAPSLHRGQIFPAGLLGDTVRLRAASGGDGAVSSSFTFTLSWAYQGCWGPLGVTLRGEKV